MISNERSRIYGHSERHYRQQKPAVSEETLKTAQIQIERKTFLFTLKENPRGRFLRISEEVGGRRDSVIVPSTGLAEFAKVVEDMVRAANELPPPQNPPDVA